MVLACRDPGGSAGTGNSASWPTLALLCGSRYSRDHISVGPSVFVKIHSVRTAVRRPPFPKSLLCLPLCPGLISDHAQSGAKFDGIDQTHPHKRASKTAGRTTPHLAILTVELATSFCGFQCCSRSQKVAIWPSSNSEPKKEGQAQILLACSNLLKPTVPNTKAQVITYII